MLHVFPEPSPAGFIHGDLFGKNVFVRGDCTLGLGDFGYSAPVKVRVAAFTRRPMPTHLGSAEPAFI